jgi:hypothetical protein
MANVDGQRIEEETEENRLNSKSDSEISWNDDPGNKSNIQQSEACSMLDGECVKSHRVEH